MNLEADVPYYEFFWTREAIEHLAEHDVTQDDFEHAVCHPIDTGHSDSSGRPACHGFALDGRLLFCVYDEFDELTIHPVTAYEIGDD